MPSRRPAPLLFTAFAATAVLLPWALNGLPAETPTESSQATAPLIVERPLVVGGGETVRDIHQDTPFSMVALTAADASGTEARIRAKKGDGSWGPWYDAEHLEVVGNREKLVKFFKDTPKTIERSLAPDKPQLELIKAIEQDKICGSNFDYSVTLTKLCLFGNLAIQNPGKVVNWDTAKQATGDAEVDKLLKRAAYRQGWEYSAAKI